MARVEVTLAVAFAFSLASGLAVIGGHPAHAQNVPDQAATKAKTSRKGAPKKADAASTEGAETKKARDPADIQKLLGAAQKSLDGGKADVAVGQIDSLIGGGGLDSRSMARALAIRGQAYRRQGKAAQAIADLQSALWLKGGLTDSERAAATEARAEAYREAGLGAPAAPPAASAQAPAAKPVAQSAPTRQPTVTASIPEKPAPAAAPAQPSTSSSNPIGGFFSNLFGGGSAKTAAAPPAPIQQPTSTSPPPAPAVSSWMETGQSKAKTPPVKAAAVTVAPATKTDASAEPASVPASTDGKLVLRLAAQRSPQDAKAVAEKIRREFATEVGGRSYQIDEVTFGNMGTFYRANFGPYASVDDAKRICASIRGKGVDCQVISH